MIQNSSVRKKKQLSFFFSVVDAGNFDWSQGKFSDFTDPSPGYHGLKFWETFGKLAFTFRLRTETLRDVGACQNPFGSFLLLQGMFCFDVLGLDCIEN